MVITVMVITVTVAMVVVTVTVTVAAPESVFFFSLLKIDRKSVV